MIWKRVSHPHAVAVLQQQQMLLLMLLKTIMRSREPAAAPQARAPACVGDEALVSAGVVCHSWQARSG